MTALEKIFQGYYEERLNGDRPDPEPMNLLHTKIMEALEFLNAKDIGSIMEAVSLYSTQAEKTGFMAGFQFAWGLLKDMQEKTA